MADRELLVRIVGDDRDLQRALGRTERSVAAIDNRTAAFGRNVGRAFAAAGIAVGTAAIFEGLGDSIAAASDLNEQVSKSRQVFGDSSREIEAWAQTTAKAFGISERAALTATGTFGNLFRVVDILPAQAAEMSQELVELAADLASFNNASPDDALQALRSGLIGEVEPLRRFGVLLSEARVQQVAMAATGKANAKELTNQEKALARYNIILGDTAPAQGDFARTSQGLANQSRILRAQLADLSAELGSNLVPTMIAAASAANSLFDAFEAFRHGGGGTIVIDVERADIQLLEAARQQIAAMKGESDLLVQALDQVISRLRAVGAQRPDDRGGVRGPGAVSASNALVEAREAERAAKQAKAANERRQKAFDEFIKGQGLKLDRAALTATLNDDLAVLAAIEAAILKRIAREGRTFDLVDQLTQVRLQRASLVKQNAVKAGQAAEDGFSATLDALTLDLDVAQSTKSLADDQAALRAIEQAILKRIDAEGGNTDLMRQLFQVREQQADVARQLADQARERKQGKQFEALGLTEEGDERVPGADSLRRRRASLEEQIKGTALDTNKTRRTLERIRRVLAGDFGKVGRDVRSAILQMLNDISSAMEDGTKDITGPLTKTSGLNTKKILAGLGLSPEEINELRGRLSGFNTAGRGLPPALQQNVPTGILAGGAGGAIVVESHTTLNVDGEKIVKVVTRGQQKTRRRNPPQKRGPNRGGQ